MVLQQDFAKHRERGEGREVGLRQEGEKLMLLAALKTSTIYRGEGRGFSPHKGPRRLGLGEGAPPPCLGGKFPPLPPLAATLDGFWGCRTRWGGNPRGGAAPSLSPIYSEA